MNLRPPKRANSLKQLVNLIVIAALSLSITLSGCAKTLTVNELVEQLNQALAIHDSAKVTKLFSGERGEKIAANISQLAAVEVKLKTDTAEIEISWKISQEQPWALSKVKLNLDSRNRISDLSAIQGESAPIWILDDFQINHDGNIYQLGNSSTDWLKAAKAAYQNVSNQFELTNLVIETPASVDEFQMIIGAQGNDLETTGAITYQLDDAITDGNLYAVHILVSPESNWLDEIAKEFLLTHESVHVATADLGQPAEGRLWTMEGLAEAVALQAYPVFAKASAQLLKENCPLPSEAPSDQQLRSGDELAYALAALAAEKVNVEDYWDGQNLALPDITAGICS